MGVPDLTILWRCRVVKQGRVRIAQVMVFVALVALNLGALRALIGAIGARTPADPFGAWGVDVWGSGALILLNALAIGLWFGCRCRGNHRFLWGFELFGVTGLVLYISGVATYTQEFVDFFLWPILTPLYESLRRGPYLNTTGILILELSAAVLTALPLLVFALIGGFLVRNFRYKSRKETKSVTRDGPPSPTLPA